MNIFVKVARDMVVTGFGRSASKCREKIMTCQRTVHSDAVGSCSYMCIGMYTLELFTK